MLETEHVMHNLGIQELKKYQRNRYPVLLLDMIDEVLPGKYAKGHKCYSYNEWYFPGHFDDEPNVPGFVQIETLAQTFIMTFLTLPEHVGKKTAFVQANNVTFKRKIIPGERLDTEATLKFFRHGVARGHVTSKVNDEEAVSADFIVCLPDIVKALKPKEQ